MEEGGRLYDEACSMGSDTLHAYKAIKKYHPRASEVERVQARATRQRSDANTEHTE